MERIINNEERIRRAELVALRRRMNDNKNTNSFNKKNILKNNTNENQRTSNLNRIGYSEGKNNEKKKISKFAKFSIQVISSICIFGVAYYFSQNYSEKTKNIKNFLNNDIDIVKQATDFYSITKSIFTGENWNYWKDKLRRK